MRKRLIEKLTNKKKGTLGYTLTEMLVVVGIIAIACAIAIPSIISISRTLRFAQANNYAKSIFLAAQQNLTELRSDGGLGPVQAATGRQIPQNNGFPLEFRSEYVYTTTGDAAFNLVLPAGSIDADVRDDQIIIEYNPLTGNVYAVFYCADELVKGTGASLLELYQAQTNPLPRDKDSRRGILVGYYDGSGLNSSQIELEQTQAIVEFVNGEEGVVRVLIPMPESFFGEFSQFAGGLEVSLDITGDYSIGTLEAGEVPVPLTLQLDETKYEVGADGKTVIYEFPIDSLASRSSFANYASGTQSSDPGVATSGASLTTLQDEDAFTNVAQETVNNVTRNKVYQILPGENITIQANVTYNGQGAELVRIAPGLLAGVNPMFEYLQPSGNGGYILAVSNGRNLQNLNAIAPTIAKMVETVVFTSDIYWNDTVAYYNTNYGSGNTYYNTHNGVYDEAPARALPYFVPIHNADLFGTAQFIFPKTGDGVSGYIQNIVNSMFGSYFNLNGNVPTLTDEIDVYLSQVTDASGNVTYKTESVKHAAIEGQNHKVFNLNIDSTKYSVPNDSNSDVTKRGRFYATGDKQIVNYYFTGLFGYVNTPINKLHVVNPIVKGADLISEQQLTPTYGNTPYFNVLTGKWEYPVTGYQYAENFNNPATGALLGAGGYNTLITNCSTYIDKDPKSGYQNLVWGPYLYSATGEQNWYGVSGAGAVGGLVGYAKSHRTTMGIPDGDEAALAFSKCFAAVPVSGKMQSLTTKDFGYSNGVGGFIGNSQMTNFYMCYSSGDVYAQNCYTSQASLADPNWHSATFGDSRLKLLYTGRKSWGAGGFAGSSHGTRYASCFAAGDVEAFCFDEGSWLRDPIIKGAGGFVGQMILDGDHTYGNSTTGNDDARYNTYIAQTTIFTDCYAVGEATLNGAQDETFSGANGRTLFQNNTSIFFRDNVFNSDATNATYVIGDFYRLYAPHVAIQGSAPDYSDIYVFRNSYYIADYHMDNPDAQANSNGCADPEPYDTFVNLTTYHQSGSTWIENQIGHIKEIKLTTPLFGWQTGTYGSRYFPTDGTMEKTYDELYDDAYSTGTWEKAGVQTTHGYGMTGVYPFMKLVGMDYYGDWPSKPADVGIAYYESYVGDDGYYHYFDRAGTSTLKDGSDTEGNPYVVDEDGFAILSASKSDMEVSFNDNAFVTISAATKTFEERHIFYLTADQIAEAANCLEEMKKSSNDPVDTFYVEVTVKQDGKTYTMYFNPYVALSQVNPVEDNVDAVKPDAVPTTIYVRSARQFKGIASLNHFWGAEYSYIQQMHIDAAEYLKNAKDEAGNLVKDEDGNPVKVKWTENDRKVSSIGTEENIFNASYTGAYTDPGTLEEKQYTLAGLRPAEAGLFGVIGAEGSVSDLIVECDGAAVGGKDEANVAILAGVNNGAIDNVTLTITGPVSLTATANAGLLAGLSTGTVTDCAVTTDDDAVVTISASNAGGLIGSVPGTEALGGLVSNTPLTLGAALNIEKPVIEDSTNEDEASANAGGYIGYASYLTLEQPVVVLKSVSTDMDYAGGLIGYVKNSTITGSADAGVKELTVEALAANGYAAGILGGGKNTVLTAMDIEIETVSGDVAAGFLGTGENVDASNCTVRVTEKLEGQTGAAGVAGIIGPQCVFDRVPVTLTGATVQATEGNAAGYALEIQGEAIVMDSSVTLGAMTNHTTASIVAKTDAAGFACVISGSVGTSDVTGHGTISGGNNAAGYAVAINGAVASCHVSPAHNDADYLGNANSNLLVSGANAAGFVMNIGENTEIANSYTLCAISASGTVETEGEATDATEAAKSVKAAYGFAGTNEGTINRCMANVDITGGYAFVGANEGLVTTSYGWFDDGSKESYDTIVELIGDGKCFNSYFADLNPVKKSDESAVLYDEKGTAAKVTPSELQNAEINGFITGYNEYPYGEMEPADYLYPMLRDHYGNWVTPPQYAYGVAYYELYRDGSYKIHLIDLSDASKTEEGVKVVWYDNFNEDGIIDKAGYAQFFNTQTGNYEGTKVLDHKIGDYVYALYAIADAGEKTYTNTFDASKSVTIDTRYADAMVEGAAFPADYVYQIRTDVQLDNIQDKSAASFVQKHSISAEKFATFGNFTGRYNGSGLPLIVANGNAWITNLGSQGIVENLDLTVTGAVTAPVFVTVNGKLELDALNLGPVDQGGALVTNADGSIISGPVTIGAVSGNVFGTVNGTVKLGEIKLASVSENGSLIGLINKTSATVTTGTIRVGTEKDDKFTPGAVAGRIFGKSIGKITVGTSNQEADVITTGAVAGQIFGEVANTTIQGNIAVGQVSGQVFGNVNGTVNVNGTITSGEITAAANSKPAGQIFGNVNENLTVTKDIVVGAVNGKVFGTVAANKTLNVNGAIRIDTASALNGKIFEGVSGTVNLNSDLVLGDIGTNGEVFGDGADDSASVNNVTAGKITANTVGGKIFANVSGTVKTGAITVGTEEDDKFVPGAVNGQIFGNSTGTITVGTLNNTTNVITTGAVSGQVFGDVAGTTIHGNIAVGQVSGKVFGNVTGTAEINGAITIDTTIPLNGKIFEGVAGTVNLSSDLVLGDIGDNGEVFGDGADDSASVNNVTAGKITASSVDGMIFADVSGTVNTGAITVGTEEDDKFVPGAVNGQIFGNSTGTITVGTLNNTTNVITTGAVTGQIFGDVGSTTIHGNIAVGQVSGKVFGNVTGTAEINGAVTIDTTTPLNGKIFEGVAGTVNLNSDLVLGDIGDNGEVFGDGADDTASVNNVTVGKITANTVGGKIFAGVSGTVNTGAITVGTKEDDKFIPGAVTGQIFGNVVDNGSITVGTLNNTTDVITTGAVTGQVFGDVAGTTIHGNITTVGNTVSGKIFGNVTGTVTVNGTITTGEIPAAAGDKPAGQIFGTIGSSTAKNFTVTVEKISTSNKAVNGSVFGDVYASVSVTDQINIGALGGQIFGNSTGTITVGDPDNEKNAITTGAVDGQIFGDVAGTTIHGNITTSGNTVSGKVFGNVNGTVTVNGTITTGEISAAANNKPAGQIFGTIGSSTAKNFTVTVEKISASNKAVNGSVFGDVYASVSVTDQINIGALGGQIFGSSTGTITVGDPDNEKNAITTGDVSGTNWLITSVSGGTVKLGGISVTDTDNTVPTMIGAISGGTVSGGTVSLGAANTSGNLFTSVTDGATLSGFAVNTTGRLGASLIGSNAATVNQVSVNAASATATGGVLVGNNSGVITNSSVKVTTVTGTSRNGNFGVIADRVDSQKTATGNTVEMTTLNVTAQAGDVIGGMFGSNAGTISGSTVEATLNVSGVADTDTVIGGLVGVNSGDITMNAQSTVFINYKQPDADTDQATIGGLIGQMNGGKLTDTTGEVSVSGAINLQSTGTTVDSKRSYIIGGAVGEDSGATYTGVNATVNVSANWSGARLLNTNATLTADKVNPSGTGPVGKFVGYISTGKFKNCSGLDQNTATAYQFMGEIAASAMTPAAYKNTVYSTGQVTAYQSGEDTAFYVDKAANANNKFEIVNTNALYVTYTAELEECFYSGKLNADSAFSKIKQTIGAGTYFYSLDSTTSKTIYNAAQATAIENGKMYVVTYSPGDGNTYALMDNNGSKSKLAVSKTEFNDVEDLDMLKTVWCVDSSGKWKNLSTNNYICLRTESGFLGIKSYYLEMTADEANGSSIVFGTADGVFKLYNGSTYLSYSYYSEWYGTANEFSASNENNAKNFVVYEITTAGVQTEGKFSYKAQDEVLKYEAVEAITVTLSLEAETDLPGETGEAPEDTEVVETTDMTEPAATE